jgi:hypothetical protein
MIVETSKGAVADAAPSGNAILLARSICTPDNSSTARKIQRLCRENRISPAEARLIVGVSGALRWNYIDSGRQLFGRPYFCGRSRQFPNNRPLGGRKSPRNSGEFRAKSGIRWRDVSISSRSTATPLQADAAAFIIPSLDAPPIDPAPVIKCARPKISPRSMRAEAVFHVNAIVGADAPPACRGAAA